METSQGNRAWTPRVRPGSQWTGRDARPMNGMAKAALPSTQSLGLKRQGVRRLAEAHTEEVYRSLSIRFLYSLTLSQRGRRPVKGTNGSLNHSLYAERRRNGDVLRQDAEEARGKGSENLRGTRSFHSSQRQVTPATRRRKAGCVWIKLQGLRNANKPTRKTIHGWRAVYLERGPYGSVGGAQKPGWETN
jgi:hypothetical protein